MQTTSSVNPLQLLGAINARTAKDRSVSNKINKRKGVRRLFKSDNNENCCPNVHEKLNQTKVVGIEIPLPSHSDLCFASPAMPKTASSLECLPSNSLVNNVFRSPEISKCSARIEIPHVVEPNLPSMTSLCANSKQCDDPDVDADKNYTQCKYLSPGGRIHHTLADSSGILT
jgi:hypothetical protein